MINITPITINVYTKIKNKDNSCVFNTVIRAIVFKIFIIIIIIIIISSSSSSSSSITYSLQHLQKPKNRIQHLGYILDAH